MLAYQKGKLTSWNDDRGFGFIEPGNGVKKIFLHISALKKHGRRPKEGDIIYYQLDMDKKNRVQASNAYIGGVQYRTASKKQVSRSKSNDTYKYKEGSGQKAAYKRRGSKVSKPLKRRSNALLFFVVAAVVVISIIIHFNKSQKRSVKKYSTSTPSSFSSSSSQQYQCTGKTRCTEMTSCEEAEFYLRNCSGVKIDGDGDGIPCEDQWCGH